jgi:polyisoprenoid-binding protein YceI
MHKLFYIILFSILFPLTQLEIDQDKSFIKWKGTKSNGSYHDGLIAVNNSILHIDSNNILIDGEIIIDMNSIICADIKNEEGNQNLVEHLKTDDFFSTTNFPTALLKINKVTAIKDNDYRVNGDLTIKNQTHPIEFIANIIVEENMGLASGKIEIDRAKYNIKYKSKSWYPDIGDMFINDIFELYFNLLAVKK